LTEKHHLKGPAMTTGTDLPHFVWDTASRSTNDKIC